jgi:hypothetical protein
MWECALCRKIMRKNSGLHRSIRTKSGHYRIAGLYTRCASRRDADEMKLTTWMTGLLAVGLALLTGVAAYAFMANG